jgi:branched-chain amino acid transport system substrate-binding protein
MESIADRISVGVLFSRSGPYASLGREGYDGALMAIHEINATSRYSFKLVPEIRDPAGQTELYPVLSRDILETSNARFIVGCTTSWSRKEVIPVLEKTGAHLWYPCAYEGFECNDHVVYVGACPNQNIVPLLDYILERYQAHTFLVGSNYVWGWEINRIAREIIERAGGEVLGERYVALGDQDIDHIIEEIRAYRPGFIVNTLIGPSSVAFFRAYRELAKSDPSFAANVRPIVSCDWTEPEVKELGEAAAGHLNIAPYFQALQTPANEQFSATLAKYVPDAREISAFFVQAYACVHMIAQGIAATQKNSTRYVLKYACENDYHGPLGAVRIQAANNHASLSAIIGRARAEGGFDIVSNDGIPVVPDPYLADVNRPPPSAHADDPRRIKHLRVIK